MRRAITQIDIYNIIQLVGWTVVVAISLSWSISGQRREALQLALVVARTHIDKDILYRRWNTMHGGIYVPITAETPPNPYLDPSIIKDRDITTDTGRRLTLMNPSYMTRQVYDMSSGKKEIAGHMTSLKPIRAENRPDAWEAKALLKFEQGDQEISDIVVDSGIRYLRLIKPFVTEKECLRCHKQQGYKIGDIRGGISVKLNLEPFERSMREQSLPLWIGHGSLWFLGVLGIWAGSVSVRRHLDERNRVADELHLANIMLEHKATTDNLTGISNRQKGSEVLNYELRRVSRYEVPLSLIMFDIDHFKMINDTYGHDTGDTTLVELGRLVAANVRASDLFARWGGEEFLIICTDTAMEDATTLAEKLRTLIAAHTFPVVHQVTCSFGVSCFRTDDIPETLVKRCDEAMYRAKHLGRDRVESG
jgi:diguanylate cyclase (GGDEF)-like protein